MASGANNTFADAKVYVPEFFNSQFISFSDEFSLTLKYVYFSWCVITHNVTQITVPNTPKGNNNSTNTAYMGPKKK
jgi:hypothetical protein